MNRPVNYKGEGRKRQERTRDETRHELLRRFVPVKQLIRHSVISDPTEESDVRYIQPRQQGLRNILSSKRSPTSPRLRPCRTSAQVILRCERGDRVTEELVASHTTGGLSDEAPRSKLKVDQGESEDVGEDAGAGASPSSRSTSSRLSSHSSKRKGK